MAKTGNMASFKISSRADHRKRANNTTLESYMRVYIYDEDIFSFQGQEYDFGEAEEHLRGKRLLPKKL